jgi:hypothetical protein
MNDPQSPSRNRFRHEQAALAAALRGLLGQAADTLEFMGPQRAAEIDAEFLQSHRAADEYGSGVVEKVWPEAEIEVAADVIHRLARNVGARPIWIIVPLSDAQAVAMPNELPLDNPLGFAALADSELRLLDQELPAGLWFLRHTHHVATNQVDYSWELSVWGEPWASAAMRALRGIG